MTAGKKIAYLDHAATTPVDPRVVEAMMPYWSDSFGNASSMHTYGRRARVAMEEAREVIAGSLGVEPSEIIFTAGGTEAANIAIATATASGMRVICSRSEHEAVLKGVEAYDKTHGAVTWLPVGSHGEVLPSENASGNFLAAMLVNNETGVYNDPVLVRATMGVKDLVYYADCVQALGYYDLDLRAVNVNLASFSAHKIGGPKGIGALYVDPEMNVARLMLGGEQEQGRRAGTENVAAIVGFARALEIADEYRTERTRHVRYLRERLLSNVNATLGEAVIVNSPTGSDTAAPHILNLAFPPLDGQVIDGEMLILSLDIEGVMVSAGSACTSGSMKPSHVLLAAGVDVETASASVRFSLSHTSTEEEVDYAVEMLAQVYGRMRNRQSKRKQSVSNHEE